MDISPERLRQHVKQLSYPRNRLDLPRPMQQAEDYVLAHFGEFGWEVSRQPYTVDAALQQQARNLNLEQRRRLPDCSGCNLIAYRPGSRPGPVLLIGAHLDTLTPTPGADDNTSGVAGLLELARVLPPCERSLALVVFDMEEWNLLGSTFFAARPPWPLAGAIIYECIGYFSDQPETQHLPPGLGQLYPRLWRTLTRNRFRGDFTLLVYRAPGKRLARNLQAAFRTPVHLMRDPADLPIIGSLLSKRFPFLDNLSRSDHAPLWQRGVPALMVTDTAEFRNANYHQTTDLPETLDYERMAEVVQATARLAIGPA